MTVAPSKVDGMTVFNESATDYGKQPMFLDALLASNAMTSKSILSLRSYTNATQLLLET